MRQHVKRGVDVGIELKIAPPRMLLPRLEVLGEPGVQLEAFALQRSGVGLFAGEKQKHFDDLPQSGRLVMNQFQGAAIIVGVSIAAERDIELAQHGG